MKYVLATLAGVLSLGAFVSAAKGDQEDASGLERQFRNCRSKPGASPGRCSGCTATRARSGWRCTSARWPRAATAASPPRSRPHNDWLGPGWYRDLAICLEAAKKHDLKMWIFDEKWWPSQGVGGKVPPRYAAKRLEAAAVDVEGPRDVSRPRATAASATSPPLAGRVTADGKIDGDSLVDLAPHIRDGKLSWQVPAGKWKVMKFTHVQAPAARPERATERRRRQQGLRRLVPPDRLSAALRPLQGRLRQDHPRLLLRRAGDPRRLGHRAERACWPSGRWTGRRPTSPTSSSWPARSRSPRATSISTPSPRPGAARCTAA